jgi:hypothetical protein
MGQRNWCGVNWDQRTGELVFNIRVEKEKGIGTTVRYVDFVITSLRCILQVPTSYVVKTPPPRWTIEA